VDCIYIDPPYNSGARDWKYNNDYVDDSDAYRHSKWLAFMERRLRLAKDLLNPERSVLIVAIDEKEYLRLGMLLQQLLPGIPMQMVTVVINPNGVARGREMARVEEYLFFMFLGDAGPSLVSDSLLDSASSDVAGKKGVRWEWLLRGGNNSRRTDRPNLFYPIFIDPTSGTVSEIGEPLPPSASRETIPPRPGLVTVWPVRTTGEEASWQLSPGSLSALLRSGHARVGQHDAKSDRWSLLYLGPAQRRRIDAGQIRVTGQRADGSLITELGALAPRRTPKTVWNRAGHKAGEYGSTLIKRFIGDRAFQFPKALYAVEDALRIAVGDNPEAVVLDFFAGSGTTTHAIMRLNRQDGGQRLSIAVTNNELAVDEADELRRRGLRPGSHEWEALGIFEYITRPRVTAAVTGQTPSGESIEGDYKFTDEFPMSEGFEENVEFMELTYLDPDDIELDLSFAGVAPLLWLRAGARGPVIDSQVDDQGNRKPFEWTSQYGILFDTDRWRGFVAQVPESATTAFVVTDSQTTFAGIAAELPREMDVVRLYENYLTTFRISET
jgi:adenine-specific DNA-methyltransferase